MLKQSFFVTSILLVIGGLVGGCKVTGGGTIPSASNVEGEKATYTITANNDGEYCQFNAPKGKITYHDKYAPRWNRVDLHSNEIIYFDGEDAYFKYNSTNPLHPGEGYAGAYFYTTDQGENVKADYISIFVYDGPYEGYHNDGYIQGNLILHDDGCIW